MAVDRWLPSIRQSEYVGGGVRTVADLEREEIIVELPVGTSATGKLTLVSKPGTAAVWVVTKVEDRIKTRKVLANV